jgi:hypothetical protein
MQRRIRHHRIHLYPYAFTNLPSEQPPFMTPNPTPLAIYLRKNVPSRLRLRKIHLIVSAEGSREVTSTSII